MMFIYNVDLEQLLVIVSRGCEGFSMKEFGKELGETSCWVCTITQLLVDSKGNLNLLC